MRDLPGSGMEPVSPALAGGFFTTKPIRGARTASLSPVDSLLLTLKVGTWLDPVLSLGPCPRLRPPQRSLHELRYSTPQGQAQTTDNVTERWA